MKNITEILSEAKDDAAEHEARLKAALAKRKKMRDKEIKNWGSDKGYAEFMKMLADYAADLMKRGY